MIAIIALILLAWGITCAVSGIIALLDFLTGGEPVCPLEEHARLLFWPIIFLFIAGSRLMGLVQQAYNKSKEFFESYKSRDDLPSSVEEAFRKFGVETPMTIFAKTLAEMIVKRERERYLSWEKPFEFKLKDYGKIFVYFGKYQKSSEEAHRFYVYGNNLYSRVSAQRDNLCVVVEPEKEVPSDSMSAEEKDVILAALRIYQAACLKFGKDESEREKKQANDKAQERVLSIIERMLL